MKKVMIKIMISFLKEMINSKKKRRKMKGKIV